LIVCICEGLSERAITERIDAGDRSVTDLGRSCGAGADCGSCSTQLRQMLDRRLADASRRERLAQVAK